jgi:CRP/FNR family transcriptional regulator/CRP/FNR family cyclic AMP-dependent transcriptional regulator
MDTPKFSHLNRVPLFDGLSSDEFETLSTVVQTSTFPKSRLVILAREEGDSFFIILRGRVKVAISGTDGREMILSVLGRGEFFGELSLLDGRPRSASVTTLEETTLLVLRRSDFLRILNEQPSLAIKLIVGLASRLRKADMQMANLALLGITDRISNVLLGLAQDHGVQTDEGVLIQNRPTHQTLAGMSGTARETVTRVLKRLEAAGYIRSKGRQVLILNQDLVGK